MTDMTITIEHGGKTYYAQPATITKTTLDLTGFDAPCATAYLHCEGDGWGVGVGGMGLDAPVRDKDDKFSHREGSAWGLDHLIRIVETVGAKSWEDLAGKHVLVLFKDNTPWGSSSVGIASFDGSRVLVFKEHVEAWETQHGGELS